MESQDGPAPPPAHNTLYDNGASHSRTNYGYNQASDTNYPGPEIPTDKTSPTEDESESAKISLQDQSAVSAFVKKVYIILAGQLVIIGAIVCPFTFSDTVQTFSQRNQWFYLTAIGLFVFLGLGITAGHQVAHILTERKCLTIIIFFVLTATVGLLLGSIGSYYDTGDNALEAVWYAFSPAFLMSIGCRKVEVTWKSELLTYFLGSLAGYAIVCAITRVDFLLHFYAWLGAALFLLWVLADLRMMVRSGAVSSQDSVMAVVKLYADLVIFPFTLVVFFCKIFI